MGRRLLAGALTLVGLWENPASAGHSSTVSYGGNQNLQRTCVQKFRALPYLTHPTSTGIRVNMIPEDSFDLRIAFSPASALVWGTTGIVTQIAATADTRTHLVAAPNPTINTLTAGTQFKYLVECRTAAGSPWQVVQKAYFKTLQTSAAAVVRAVVIADDHTTSTHRETTCIDPGAPNGMVTDIVSGLKVNRLDMLAKTQSNIASSGGDYIVIGGDSAILDAGAVPAAGTCPYRREDGTSQALTFQSADDQTEQELRWEVFLHYWQPLMAFIPTFPLPGNHESMWGYGGAGAALLCNLNSQNLANTAVTAYNNMFGNFNDTYPNGTAAGDLDGDTVVENEENGLFFEFASGSLRWFSTDNQRYTADVLTGAPDTVPAALFPGFVARAADTPAATFGSVPSPTAQMNGSDSYEDNVTMGGEETAWLIARTAAKAEAFGAVISHRINGGFNTHTCYFYSRGLLATRDDNGDGFRSPTESWDADADGDLMDEHYVNALLDTNAVQIRFVAHDHFHLICRKNNVNYIEIGQPTCTGGGTCTNEWVHSFEYQTSQVPSLVDSPTLNNSMQALHKSYDCNGDGNNDSDPFRTESALDPRALSNEGITGANGTLNKGYGLLTVNGATDMQWQWVVTDMFDEERNNDRIISYGPILP